MTEPVAALGVDCASHKSEVFDGRGFRSLTPSQLEERLTVFEEENDVGVICWDAPLTGPPSADEVSDSEGAYSTRPIERFCNPARKGSPLWQIVGGDSPPSGVNTRGYSGMSHWAITQALTGHPRVNSRYLKQPRLPLLAESHGADLGNQTPFTMTDVRLAEVHPAIAIWLWVEPHLNDEEREDPARFEYKKGSAAQKRQRTERLAEQLLHVLEDRVGQHNGCRGEHAEVIYGSRDRAYIRKEVGGDHNKLDAYVAWVLGRLATHCEQQIVQLGSLADGAILLPFSEELQRAWTCFTTGS